MKGWRGAGPLLLGPHMSTKAKPGQLYFHREYDCYECLGCGALIEVPWRAVLKNGQSPVEVKENPENRLLWVELMELDHAPCLRFSDARMAEQARRYGNRVVTMPRGDDGRRSSQNQARVAS